jgi:hypothetical protein
MDFEEIGREDVLIAIYHACRKQHRIPYKESAVWGLLFPGRLQILSSPLDVLSAGVCRVSPRQTSATIKSVKYSWFRIEPLCNH